MLGGIPVADPLADRREVVDGDDVIVRPQSLEEFLKVEPLVSRSLNRPSIQVEPVDVDAGAFFRVGH